MTQLRQRMIEDMRVRNFSPVTIRRYTDCVAAFARHYQRCPSTLGSEEVREYQVYLAVDLKRSFTVLNQTVCALRFLYRVTLRSPFPIELIPYAKREKKIPVILSRDEVQALLGAATCAKHHAIIATFYSTGIRLSELRSLKTEQIDASRETIHIHGKGSRDRLVPLCLRLITLLRGYWREQSLESPWLFPGLDPEKPLCRETIQAAVSKTARSAGLKKKVTPHLLRHTFATHLLESGVDILRIQRLLGHARISTTLIYVHIATDYLKSVKNPFDLLPADEENDGADAGEA